MRFWPRTLAVQLITVTAAVVVLSNVLVAIYFEQNNFAQGQNFINDRMIDRTTAVVTTLREIPPQSRNVVLRTMSSPNWRFSMTTSPGTAPMTEEETVLARRIQEGLAEGSPVKGAPVVRLHINPQTLDRGIRPHRIPPGSDAAITYVPIDNQTYMSGVFVRQPPDLPREIIAATAVAILLASVAAAFFARRIVRPLSQLTAAARVVAQGGTAPHVNESGPEDVRNAAIAFNKMTEQVTKTLESQRHLLSAVGHDLRTPITAMRINLEFVADDELRDGLARNLDELQEMTEQVLSAARGAGGETPRNVDLSALVESLCTDLEEMGEPVTWVNHGPAPLSCRPNEIRRAVRNLVENAVAYGGKADVHIDDTPGGYDIVVEDDGPGIPEDDQMRVFEPFVRLESSRNEATGGTGLGLTLVKAIVEGHGGAISLENRPGGGLRARITLPRQV